MALRESAEGRRRDGDLIRLLQARLMLGREYAYRLTVSLPRELVNRLARDLQNNPKGPNGRIPRGDRSREVAMPKVSLTMGGSDLGEITQEELHANDALRARAAKLRERTAAVLKAEPQPSGDRMNPEELAKAMGATLIGKTSKNQP